MNIIDHAILIPASPEFIWRFLGDLSQNSQWQDDCENLSFLTTQHDGRGARWRYTTPKGKDVIAEISAWYDTLGYEYTIIDGFPVSQNQGRIRLQEIAEGTLVQWTFNYEVDGMLSGLMNTISIKRSLTNMMQESLRNLYKLIQKETGGISTHEAKSSLREAPDVEQRSSYQPRHPSAFKEKDDDFTYAEDDNPLAEPIRYSLDSDLMVEPPVAEDDTKPNPSINEEITAPETPQFIEEPPVAEDDTKPNKPIDVLATDDDTIEPEPLPTLPETSDLKPPADIRDTSRISVFEIFGLQKPSETQDIVALTEEDLKKSAQTTVESPTPEIEKQADQEPVEDVSIEITEEIDSNSVDEIEIQVSEDIVTTMNIENTTDAQRGFRRKLRQKLVSLRKNQP